MSNEKKYIQRAYEKVNKSMQKVNTCKDMLQYLIQESALVLKEISQYTLKNYERFMIQHTKFIILIIYNYIHIFIYIYIPREREKDRESQVL